MEPRYYFEFEEPYLKDKNIICSFCISYIAKKRCYFFIVEGSNELVVYYLQISSSEMINFIKEYEKSMNIDKKTTIEEIYNIPDFLEKYNNRFTKSKILNNPLYVKETIDKMLKDNIYEVNNKLLGLDGFSVNLKLNKEEKRFHSWCVSDDYKHFYILDFINYILDELEINNEYRFKLLR